MRNLTMLLPLALWTLPACANSAKKPESSSDTPSSTPASEKKDLNRELLVAFKSAKDAEGRAKLFSKYKLKELEKVGSTPLYLVQTEAKADLKELQKKLGKESGVKFAEPNQRMRTFE